MILIMILFSINSYSQITPGSEKVGVGYGIEKDDFVAVDSLNFKKDFVLLMQDNSTLVVKEKITGKGIILYGDIGDDIPNSELISMERVDPNGNVYFDYRFPSDTNPKIIFLKCVEKKITMTYGPNIDVEFPEDCESGDCNSREWTDEELSEYPVIIYNALGQRLFKGKFKQIYNPHGKIKPRFTKSTIIIRIQIDNCVLVLKRRYVIY